MLGSVQDAEDALQDTLLRAWRGLDRFEGRNSPRSWLYRIATNACLDASTQRAEAGSSDRPHARAPIDRGRLARAEPGRPRTPRYEQRESVELAFIAALQHLPANQRAVLILREVLGFSAKEVAAMLDTTPAFGQQRDAARARVGRGTAARALPAGTLRALAGRRADPRAGRTLRRGLGPR